MTKIKTNHNNCGKNTITISQNVILNIPKRHIKPQKIVPKRHIKPYTIYIKKNIKKNIKKGINPVNK